MLLDFLQNSDTIYEKLELELQNLPGEDSHVEMFPGRGKSSDALKTASDYKVSAVLALLYIHNDALHGILTERQTYEGRHSGQMSFPGGKMELADKNPKDAALRETEEEIGIDRNSIQIIGNLTDVYIPVSKYLVHPYVGFVGQRPETIREEREVKSIIHFEIADLLKESNRVQMDIEVGQGMRIKDVGAFTIHDKIVWGATALMCNELKKVLQRF